MKWILNYYYYIYVIILYNSIINVIAELGDPYSILGVNRKATQQEIRKVYKQLAKEWHPDKTNDPSAEERFVQIKQAYELLSDPDRRRRYDERGITEENYLEKSEHTIYSTTNPFDDIFIHHGAYFNFQDNDITFFHKLSITTRQYDRIILGKSEKTPYLLYFYTDWCFPCLQTAPYCRKLIDYLEPLGIRFVTVHLGKEPGLGRRLSIHSLPCLVLLLDGHVSVYKGTITNIPKIIEFLREKLPYKLILRLDKNNVDNFLSGWEDNRVRGLIFEPRQTTRLRYLIAAYHFRHRVAFGSVFRTNVAHKHFVDSEEIRRKYQIPYDMDTVLLFNENITRPMASITMKDIPTSTLHHIISSNQYLALPRLSSQRILEALCPCEWNKPRKRLCVVLITKDSTIHNPHRETFRIYAQNAPYSIEKVRFAYIYHDKQMEFIKSLIPEGEPVEPLLKIVIFWRLDTSRIKYLWVNGKWERDLNHTTEKLENTIHLLQSSEALAYEAFVKDLFDEHSKGMVERILSTIIVYTEKLYDGLGREQILPAISVIGTIVFILAIGYFMAYLMKLEEETIREQKKYGNNNNDNNSNTNYQPELKLHELRAEKYNGLVRLLKPGCRTILLVLDMQSQKQLIPPFHKAVWPYRKNKTLLFSYMYIERGLSWYKELLQLSLPDDRELNINPKNCVGTILSLNGHRKYFCMFHAKHTEKPRKMRKKLQLKMNDCESGNFIGFDDSNSSDTDDEVLLKENLLNGLSNWLDRLFEGCTQRYHINYWPDFPNK